MLAMATPKSSIESKSAFKYYGYGVYDAYTNMALDEAMAQHSAARRTPYIRFYDFERPAIIFSVSDSPKPVKRLNLNGMEVTRRESGGRVIKVDQNVLSYCICEPIEKGERPMDSARDLHQRLGNFTADAIAKVTGVDREEFALPRTSSIRYKGKPIAGHSQHITGDSLLYHGLIVVAPWDIAALEREMNLSSTDLERIASLPSIMGISKKRFEDIRDAKVALIDEMLSTFFDGGVSIAETSEIGLIRSKGEALRHRFQEKDWVWKEIPERNQTSPFCILWEENETPNVKGAIAGI